MPQGGDYDVFFSYARADSALARPLRDALSAEGLRVFFDEREIEHFEGITGRLTEGVARSKALLCLYSKTYPRRRACQFELTAAFLAAQRGGDPRERVLVMNPEEGAEHVEPVELRDALFRRVSDPDDAAGIANVAESVARHVGSLNGALGDVQPLTPPPWHGLKATGSTRFVGRLPAMWQVHSALHAGELTPMTGRAGPGVAQIRGLGGIGKTLLAEEYALRFGAAYPGGVFWLRAQGGGDGSAGASAEEREGERSRQLRALAVSVAVPVETLAPEEAEAALAREVERRGRPFLWLVDDVPGGLDAVELRRWLAPHPLGKTLLTTRSGEYAALGAVVEPGVLSPEEAYELVTTRRTPEDERERAEAEALVAELGYHALAVDVAAAALAFEGAEPFAAFRVALRDTTADELELAADLADALPTGHEPSVAATLARSIERASEEGRDLLRLAAVLASAPIPAWLVDRVFAEADGLDERAARRRGLLARKQARSLSLAESAAEGEADSVHTLVARTIGFREEATPERRHVLRAAAVAVLNAELTAVADPRAHAKLALAVAHARELVLAPEKAPEAQLLGWVARYESERGDYRSAASLYRRQRGVAVRLLGEEHRDTLTATANLALALARQGELAEARRLQEEALAAAARVLGENHPDTVRAVGNLATTLSDQGELAEARRLEEEVLGVYARVLGENHPETVRAMGNLAATLSQQGELAGARRLQEEALAAAARVLGENHPDTVRAMGNLAETLRTQGELPEARRLQEEVLGVYARVLGENHPETVRAMGNLAATLSQQGELAEARRLQEEVLAAHVNALGEDHPGALIAMNNLALTLYEQGQLAEARRLQEEALAASARVRGEDHPGTVTLMGNVATTLQAQGDLAAARRLREKVRASRARVLGERHPDTLIATNNLALTLYEQGELAEARRLQEEVLAASERVLGDDHATTLTVKGNLALTLYEQGELAEARRLEEEVVAGSHRVLGEDHPDTLTAIGNLARTLWKQGDLAEARRLQEEALAASERVLGDDHATTLTVKGNLARTLYEQGALAEACRLEEEVVAASHRVFGEEHPDTLAAIRNLARTLRKQGDVARAEALEERALELSAER